MEFSLIINRAPHGAGLVFSHGAIPFLFPVIRINLQVLAVRWDNFALVDPVSPNRHGNLRKSAHIPGINGKNGAMEFSLIIKPYVTGYAAGETRL
jgi:hypothetical protein